eukprot:6173414-Pleurochrysis_carterae.AAC.3
MQGSRCRRLDVWVNAKPQSASSVSSPTASDAAGALPYIATDGANKLRVRRCAVRGRAGVCACGFFHCAYTINNESVQVLAAALLPVTKRLIRVLLKPWYTCCESALLPSKRIYPSVVDHSRK